MDLFSKFPESYKYDQFVPKIREEKTELIDPNDDDNDKENTNISKAFENIKKVNALRKRNFIIMIIAVIAYILVEFIFEDILKTNYFSREDIEIISTVQRYLSESFTDNLSQFVFKSEKDHFLSTFIFNNRDKEKKENENKEKDVNIN